MRRVFFVGFAAGMLLTAIVGTVCFWGLLQSGVQAHLDAQLVASRVEQQVLDAGHSQIDRMNVRLREDLPQKVVQITAEGFKDAVQSLYGDQLQLPEEVTRPVEQRIEEHLSEEIDDYLDEADFEPLLTEAARQSRVKTYKLLMQGEGMEMEISLMDRWRVPVQLRMSGPR